MFWLLNIREIMSFKCASSVAVVKYITSHNTSRRELSLSLSVSLSLSLSLLVPSNADYAFGCVC